MSVCLCECAENSLVKQYFELRRRLKKHVLIKVLCLICRCYIRPNDVPDSETELNQPEKKQQLTLNYDLSLGPPVKVSSRTDECCYVNLVLIDSYILYKCFCKDKYLQVTYAYSIIFKSRFFNILYIQYSHCISVDPKDNLLLMIYMYIFNILILKFYLKINIITVLLFFFPG